MVPPEKYKPAVDERGNYYQQVAFKGEALNQLGTYPREIYRERAEFGTPVAGPSRR
jgi:hypothetical protein